MNLFSSTERKHRSPYMYKDPCKAKYIKTQIPRKIIDMAAQIPAKRSSVGHLAGHVVRSDTRVRIIVQRCICDVVYWINFGHSDFRNGFPVWEMRFLS